MDNKKTFVISSPFDSFSGYGARSRDLIKAIIELNKYDVKLIAQRWGSTSWGFCKENPEWNFLLNYLFKKEDQDKKPDIWMQITIPNEFNPIGKYNIGVTAGIEATVCKPEWIEGINKMDMVWVSSEFTKKMFMNLNFQKQIPNQPNTVVRVEKPIHVVFEGANLDLYKPLEFNVPHLLDNIKEENSFLIVGHWMQGEIGHDRKNIGLTIKEFFNTFKNTPNPPALILKSSIGVSSTISKNQILEKISDIRDKFPNDKLPNVYLINGELSDKEMNILYNHPKIKCMVSLTKGEGFGRPLLEFSLIGKPIIASNWSGHKDFLNPEYTELIEGELEPIHASALNDWFVSEAKWFKPKINEFGKILKKVLNNPKKYNNSSKRQKYYSKTNFNWVKMKELIDEILDKNVKEKAEFKPIVLPKLKKV